MGQTPPCRGLVTTPLRWIPGRGGGGGRGLVAVVKETGRGWDGEAGFTGFADFNGVHTLIMTDLKPPMLNWLCEFLDS